MGRPSRADTASTRHVGFRLTQEEEDRLDSLVTEQGHKDRSALLRAWLAQGGPTPRTNPTRARRATTARTSRVTSESSRSSSSRVETKPTSEPSGIHAVLTALHLQNDPRIGLISIPRVVRSLVPRVPLADVHEALFTLAKHGTIELRPESGSEFLSEEDATVCPRGPRDTVFSFARWTDTSTR